MNYNQIIIDILILIFIISYSCETLIRSIPLLFQKFCFNFLAILKTVGSSRISDHWKEKILFFYAFRQLKCSFYFLLILLLAFFPFFLIHFNTIINLITFKGILLTTLLAVLYINIRRIFVKKSTPEDYGLCAQFLHRIALGNELIPKLTFFIEKKIFKKNILNHNQKHVFICGLARSGTTFLMHQIYNTGKFQSLSYRDMPFVLAPNISRFLNFSKTSELKERSHGDGIMINNQTPEALEEVFWKTFNQNNYLFAHGLCNYLPSDDIISMFRDYVALILRKDYPTRYISKNNNNILRIPALRKAFPSAYIIIPYREPIQHAYSLLRMHKRFIKINKQKKFTREYMDFLAHHEFGINHRTFIFSGVKSNYLDSMKLDYWIDLWIRTYGFLNNLSEENLFFVSYEDLCRNVSIWRYLANLLDVPTLTMPENIKYSLVKIKNFNSTLEDRANMLYQELNNKKLMLCLEDVQK